MVAEDLWAEGRLKALAAEIELWYFLSLNEEAISRKDPHKVAIMFFSFKSLYHPGMCLGTTRDHSRAPGAPGGHSKCTFFAFFGPGRAIIRSRAAKTLDSNSDTTAHRSLFVSSEYG